VVRTDIRAVTLKSNESGGLVLVGFAAVDGSLASGESKAAGTTRCRKERE
jgi:hypothetical protein